MKILTILLSFQNSKKLFPLVIINYYNLKFIINKINKFIRNVFLFITNIIIIVIFILQTQIIQSLMNVSFNLYFLINKYFNIITRLF